MITVLLFGSLREDAGWARRELNPSPGFSEQPPPSPARLWDDLGLAPFGRLSATPEAMARAPHGPIRVTVNHEFASPYTELHPGDEVAFMPPISGG